MIVDVLKNAQLYFGLGKNFERALRLIEETDFSTYSAGGYDLDENRDVFFKIQTYETKKPEDCKIELHKVYADIHYILEGEEQFGYAHQSLCDPKIPYNPETEMSIVSCKEMGYVIQRPGCFAIVFPEDAHQSACVYKSPCTLKKVLVKVRMPQ